MLGGITNQRHLFSAIYDDKATFFPEDAAAGDYFDEFNSLVLKLVSTSNN
ncbi:hypothetical protein [Iningainema tapete]|uniref:Uncharacterized protein n=1 Tax=Iningainema tapete BLCC-T55 TaxID=2748662 RepID=A0A8J6XGV2_9CYAN|nr:hypothetical protein [Iningainema tapete]MBD2776555.1 hypothetical protein [Iningainema tapete BLCC-T55]